VNTWKDIVSTVAPVIGRALSGPLAGTATQFMADKFLDKSDATESDIEQSIIKASPEELTKLKAIDKKFNDEMKKLSIDIYTLANTDRSNTRQLYKIIFWPQIFLSVIFVMGYFLVLFFLIENPDTLSEDRGIMGVFTTVLGVLTAAIPQILSFWFGTGIGNKQAANKS